MGENVLRVKKKGNNSETIAAFSQENLTVGSDVKLGTKPYQIPRDRKGADTISSLTKFFEKDGRSVKITKSNN